MRKIVLTFGLISGAILAVMMVLAMLFQDHIGIDKGLVVGYTSMVIAFLMVYFGTRAYRDNVAGGKVRFGQAFKVGLLITLIATACYVATWQVIYYKFMPDFFDKYAAAEATMMQQRGASAETIAKATKQMADYKEAYKNPLVNIAMTSIEPLPVGLLFTLVSAGLLSRKRRDEDAVAA